MLAVMLFLSSCTTENYDKNFCPVYPLAGAKVAEELEKIPQEKLAAFWEWIGRINKLRQELELCSRKIKLQNP